jgi:uncharacterized damage-inducible protein DinB
VEALVPPPRYPADMQTAADPTLDRLLRHMAWANAHILSRIAALPDQALACAEPGSEWTVAMTLEHLVSAAGGYAARLDGTPRSPGGAPPSRAAEVTSLAAVCAEYDARLRAAALVPEGMVEYAGEVGVRRRARSTILAQSIHHATEHRAQIAGALAANGYDQARGIDLDQIDLWAFGEAEGLGA